MKTKLKDKRLKSVVEDFTRWSFTNPVTRSVYNSVRRSVWMSVYNAVLCTVEDSIRMSVWRSVVDSIENRIKIQ
jgi:hypothetical protein